MIEVLIVTLNGDGWGSANGKSNHDRFHSFSWSGARRFDVEGFGNIGVTVSGNGYGHGNEYHTDWAKKWWGRGVSGEYNKGERK